MIKAAPSTESYASALLAVGSCAAGLFYFSIRQKQLLNKQQPNTTKNQSLVTVWQHNTYLHDWFLLIKQQAQNFLPSVWFSKVEAQPSSEQIIGTTSRRSPTKVVLSESKDDDYDDDDEKSSVVVEIRSPPRILKTKSITVDFTLAHPSLLSSSKDGTPDTPTTTTPTGTMTDDDTTASICSTASRTQRRAIFGSRVTSKYVNSPATVVPAS